MLRKEFQLVVRREHFRLSTESNFQAKYLLTTTRILLHFVPKNGLKNRLLSWRVELVAQRIQCPFWDTLFFSLLLFCIFLHFLQWWELLFVKKLGLFSSSLSFLKEKYYWVSLFSKEAEKNSNCVLDNMLWWSTVYDTQGYKTTSTCIQMLLLPGSCDTYRLSEEVA